MFFGVYVLFKRILRDGNNNGSKDDLKFIQHGIFSGNIL